MEQGMIVNIPRLSTRGVVLSVNNNMAYILHYDFSTSLEPIDDLEVVGHCDAIYKVMYEIGLTR